MEFNLADLFENAVDHFADRECLIVDDTRATFGELEDRSNRLAHHLAAHGIGRDDHVGIYARNCLEWVEAMWATFKLRAVPININFRYAVDDLSYLFDNADLAGLVFQRQFAPLVTSCRDSLPMLKHALVIEDGSDQPFDDIAPALYAQALESGSPERDFERRSGDDTYILYTGGTTGRPKGVVWRHLDQFMAFGSQGDTSLRPEDVSGRNAEAAPITASSFAPLMHNNGQWVTMGMIFRGGRAVLMARFDAHRAWELVEREKVNAMALVGDAMARPLVEALESAERSYDLSALMAISSGGATLSPAVKDRLLDLLPNVMVSETIGSTESGPEGGSQVQKGADTAAATRVTPSASTIVVGENLEPVGVGEVGKIARTGFLPIGYYHDEEKTRETFVDIKGSRYVIPGDYARVEDDGTITLLGRGSVVINTGGEKVHPEEVESVLKAHPEVFDASIVGVPDERWGERVAAVVQPRPGAVVTLESVREHCKARLAGYKVPAEIHVVDTLVRHESGKPDYRWAADVATGRV